MAKLPTVVSSLPQDLKAFVNQVREALDGRGADKLVTVDDLVRGGIAVQGANNTVASPSGVGAGLGSTPPTPRNVQAAGAIQNILVTWDDPLYNGHAYAEIWGSSTNNIGEAVRVGMAPGALFVDPVGPSVIRYYWVRFVNAIGVKGAFNAVDGTVGETGPDVEYLLDLLSGQITESELYSDLNGRIDEIDGGPGGDTGLLSKYTVKVDLAGHVAGYGIAATANTGTPTSSFGVRADQFWIAPPATVSATPPTENLYVGYVWIDSSNVTRYYDGENWQTTQVKGAIPFVVQTSPTTINGVAVPAGVYIDAAYIKDGTITNAKIGNAVIDSAKIISLTAAKITAGSIGVGSYIQSSSYIAGFQGWRIHGNGAAEFAATSIRGKLTAAQVDTRGLSVFDDAGGIILSTNTQRSLNDVAVGSSKFLAVGENGTTAFSNDGVRWPSSAIGTTTLSGVCWSSAYSKFYVVGDNGSLLSTPDGLVWEYYESNTTQPLRAITEAGTTLFAVGVNGTILKSTNGTVWQVVASGTTADLQDIMWTGSQLVVVGAGGVVRTSPDGTTWTAQISNTTQTLNGIILGGSLFVAVGNAGTIITSPDAVTWTVRTSGTAQNLNEVTYGASLFMAVGTGGVVLTSPLPATTWTSRSASTSAAFSAVTHGLSKFALVGATGLIRSSIDGTSFAAPGVNVFSGDVSGTVAGTAATTLVNTANTASSTATAAQSTATTAQSTATAAQSTANTAASAAATAQAAANAAAAGLTTKLNSDAQNVLAGSGGFSTGNLTWNSSGARTGGYGVGFSQAGIAAYNSAGVATFVLNGSNGDASFAGSLTAATGTFAGSLTAATGTFTGSLSAATGSFTGSLSAATGTFSGTLTASAINAVNTINIAGQAVTVPNSAFTAGDFRNTAALTWEDAQTLAITTTGSRVYVACAGLALGGSAIDGSESVGIIPKFRLVRDSTELIQGGSIPAMSYSDTPSAGSYTYKLQVRSDFGGSPITYAGVSNRSLFTIETKR